MNLKWTELVNKYSSKHGLSPVLVGAVLEIESGGDNWACRHEPSWKYWVTPAIFAMKNRITEDTERFLQSCSLGLMQTMGSVTRELGYTGQLTALCDPDIGLDYGCRKLRLLSIKHPKIDDVVAAYNAGTPRLMANGKYFNQSYVTKVMSLLKS